MDATPTDDQFVQQIAAARAEHTLPPGIQTLADELIQRTLALLFPHFARETATSEAEVRTEIEQLAELLTSLLVGQGIQDARAREICDAFIHSLPDLQDELSDDAIASYEADPAAESLDEVLIAYPGSLAMTYYRVAHRLHELGVALLPRLITELAHQHTGIDINPGATIGRSLAIDHGTGIVIGETAVIGDRVRLYQGVTIGALSVSKEFVSQKRHPTIGDDCIVYANASLLGGDTVIGENSVIGGNVWLTHAVPANSVVTHGATVQRRRMESEPLSPRIDFRNPEPATARQPPLSSR
jgi:serine O-acetyltransferase